MNVFVRQNRDLKNLTEHMATEPCKCRSLSGSNVFASK
jgi:hypothetical protein